MIKSILLSKRYWITVTVVGLLFVAIYSVGEHFLYYNGLAWDTFIADRIAEKKWMRYLLSRLVGGLLYGMIMGYYFELRKKKNKSTV